MRRQTTALACAHIDATPEGGYRGSPTPETWGDIPRLFGLSISRSDGEALRELMKTSKVEVSAKVTAHREWRTLSQPVGWLRAPQTSPERDQFVIVRPYRFLAARRHR
ncbi:hypothetical protein AB6806_28040 [Bosea sp. RCC_152_1]|uniref:hypothetical protein n=1 Tax=Bosea sp. RCC_152_1 TaxID=3239228 RepID=UPI003526B054